MTFFKGFPIFPSLIGQMIEYRWLREGRVLLVCMDVAAENALLIMGLGFFSASHRVAELVCERQVRY